MGLKGAYRRVANVNGARGLMGDEIWVQGMLRRRRRMLIKRDCQMKTGGLD